MRNYLRVAALDRYILGDLFCKLLLSLCMTATYVMQAICLARGTASVFEKAPFRQAAFYYLSAAALILVRSLLLRFLEGYTKQVAGKMKAVVRSLLLDRLFLLGPAYQEDKRSGKMQSLLTDGVEYLEPYLINYIPQIFIVAVSVIPMTAYILRLSRPAGLLLLVSVALSIILPPALMPFTKRSSLGYWREYAVLNSQYVDAMQGMNTLKVFHAEETKGAELAADSERFRQRQFTNTRNSLYSSSLIILMTAIGTSVTTGVAAYAVSEGQLGYAALLNIMFLAIECLRPVGDLNNYWHSSYLGLSVCNEFAALLDEPVTIQNVRDPDRSSLETGLPEVTFSHVSFHYKTRQENALSDVCFRVVPGQTAAFVGESGSGKSTIVNLLLRFYDANEGEILLNGVDIRRYDLDYLRSRIAVVFQHTFLFYGTVMENLRIARPDASEEEVIQAAMAAGAHDFILQLENGYDTLVGERGATLSGGQRQRLSIARAILKKAPLLIMDEATSSVDAATEQIIQQTLVGIDGNYTTILIAHRLSTIRHAGKIFVLQNGRLCEEGTHEELLESSLIYRQLTEAQNGGDAYEGI